LKYIVEFTTWYVAVRDGSELAHVAGPFGKEDDAAEEAKRMENSVKREGNLDQEKLEALRFRVGARRSPEKYFVTKGYTEMPNKEFTASVKKLYGEDILTKLKGRISGKRFGL